jgi:hypothetical protein
MSWEDAQAAETAWWGNCVNTYDEESMQLIEADRMGLVVEPGPVIRTAGSIVDIGGGPVSLLLKAEDWDTAEVVDPGAFPAWTLQRYAAAGIAVNLMTGEDYVRSTRRPPDEIWIYNTLQHVMDPGAVVEGACKLAPVVRIFEWIEFETNDAHIHSLLASEIERWARNGGDVHIEGDVEAIEWAGASNLSYHGVFTR